jgi:hypothetical protein
MRFIIRDLRFSIRDLFWLMAVVGLSVGWWQDARRYDWGVQTAQYRKDYYDLMSEAARVESQKAIEKQKELTDALQKIRSQSAADNSESSN